MELAYNRLWNTKNENQGPAKRVLALCSGGLLRSPTVAWVLSNAPYNYNTRSAGVDEYHALQVIDPYLVEWADEIVCVEPRITEGLMEWAKQNEVDLTGKKVVTLTIPDRYKRRHPTLVSMIEDQYVRATAK
jgi:predicted protein tyrosine phosphatase